MNNSLNKKVIQISSNKNNLSEEELNKIIDNARQMDEIDRIDKYKKEYSGYWNAILSGTGEITLEESETESFEEE